MADFPTTIYSPRTKANRSGVVYDASKSKQIFAEDIQKLDAEVVAIENFLGVAPEFGFYLLGSNTLATPIDSTTYYAGKSGWSCSGSSGYYKFNILAKIAKIKHVRFVIGRSGTVPSNETFSVYLMVNNTAHLLSDAVELNSGILTLISVDDLDIDVVKDDVVLIKFVTPAWATNPVNLVVQTEIFCIKT